MSERYNADDFEGEFTFPLPIRGTLKQGQGNKPVAEIEGTWTVLKRSSEGIWPNAIVSTEIEEFVLATYPVNHEINEVNIVKDSNIGMFFVVDVVQFGAYNWIDENNFKKYAFDEFKFMKDFVNNDTPILTSKDPESEYGRAVILWRPEIQTLEHLLHKTPFKYPKTLLEAAKAVGEHLQLYLGDIPNRLNSNKRNKSIGNTEKAKELHEKFFEK